jgi:hypothetical protein
MQSNRLKLNTNKTEVLWCAMSRRQHQLSTTLTGIGNDLIKSSTSVRDLGVYLDADLSIRSHVHNTVSKCFCHAETAWQDSSICTSLSLPNTDCVAGADEIRLWKRRTVWTISTSHSASPISHECGCQIDCWSLSL